MAQCLGPFFAVEPQRSGKDEGGFVVIAQRPFHHGFEGDQGLVQLFCFELAFAQMVAGSGHPDTLRVLVEKGLQLGHGRFALARQGQILRRGVGFLGDVIV